MANGLTGDFDVAVEFSLPAVNRILAAMHQSERFLHSIAARVDDNPHPGHTHGGPTLVGVVDAFGDPIVNQQRIGFPVAVSSVSVGSDPNVSRLGVLVNPEALGGVIVRPIPSHIQGIAQLQVFPPTVEASGANLTVRMNAMVRFFPDKDTARVAQFLRGDLTITAPVNKVATGRVHVLDIDFKADDAVINFVPSYSSESLSAGDLAGIRLCIQNGLRTSFLPSSVMLPSSIADVQLKSLPGAVAVLLDMNDHTPASNPASVANVFLNSGDDFAFAIGRDFVLSVFRSSISGLTQFQPFSKNLPILGTTTYTITLTSAPTLDLQSGSIVVTIQAHAHSSSGSFPSFNFTANVAFTLNLVSTGEGGLNAAELALASVSLDFTDSGLAGGIKDLVLGFFTGNITGQISAHVDSILNPPNPQPTDLQPTIRQMTDADANLGDHLTAQMVPADGSSQTPAQRVFLIYTSFEIQPAGIVLRGSVLLFDWPAPHVEFEPIPSQTSGHVDPFGGGPDYSALKTWIPGGTIQQYEWSYQGQPNPFHVDPNTFVLLASGPSATGTMARVTTAIAAYAPLCLTVRGTRLSNFGPVVSQPVSASACGYTQVPVVSGGTLVSAGAAPTVVLTRPGPNGLVAITGHTAAQASQRGARTPNLILHFADAKSAGHLEVLTQALDQSKKADSATAVIVVMSPGQLAKTRYTPGIIYADDRDAAWQRVFGLKIAQTALTAIVGPTGHVVWQKEGAIGRETLGAALAKHLAPTGPIRITMPRLNVRIGQPAPNFLFEFSPGQVLPLRKLTGRAAVIVFWKSSSRPSIEAVRAVETPLVLAINDGENPDLARRVAAEAGFSAIVVTDPERRISSAYGVTIWPTVVFLDSAGLVAGIHYGSQAGEHGRAGEHGSAQPASR